MSSVLARITSLKGQLSGTAARVAGYLQRHAEDAPYLTVGELAEEAGVSVASVTRLAKRLGYRGYRDLRIGLAQEISSPVSAIYAPISDSDADSEVVRKVFGGNVQSLQDTLKLLDMSDCSRAASLMHEARRIAFFGIGASATVGRDAVLRLSHLDIAAAAYGDPYDMLIQAIRKRSDEVAVGVSHSGRSSMTVDALRTARENGAATIGISSALRSPLHTASDISFCTPFAQTPVRSAALSAIPAQVCLLDALYVLIARRVGGEGVDRINELIESRFRIRQGHQ